MSKATDTSVKIKLNNLINKSNQVTGIDNPDLDTAVKNLICGYDGSFKKYEDVAYGDKLYHAYFASDCFKFINDTNTPHDDGGLLEYYDSNKGEYKPGIMPNFQWKKSLESNGNLAVLDTFKISGNDILADDSRSIGYFPDYDLENKTYTIDFEYFRNFDKRHKFYFACGNFLDSEGKPIENGGCDPTMPCLAFELRKSDDFISYKFYRQSAAVDNDTNIFNKNTIPFERGETLYRHNVSFSTSLGNAIVTYIDSDSEPYNIDGTDGYFVERITSFVKDKEINIGGRLGIGGDVEYDEFGYFTGYVYIHFYDGSTDLMTVNSSGVANDDVVQVSFGEFTAKIRMIIKGHEKINDTVYEYYGLSKNAPLNTNKGRWTGDLIPLDITIYQIYNGVEFKVGQVSVYQPAKIGLVFGIGEYDKIASNQYYGVRKLVIYKGDKINLEPDIPRVSTAEEMENIINSATDDDIGKAYLYLGESTYKYTTGIIYAITEVGGVIESPNIRHLEITENGIYAGSGDIHGYSPIMVNVPIPEGYIKPVGTKQIYRNGEYNISDFANINVNVPSFAEISTAAEMNSILANATSESVGKAYKYIGETTEAYENNAIYVIKEI